MPADSPARPITTAPPLPGDSFSLDIVIPVLNEAHVLEKSVRKAHDFLSRTFDCRWRLIVADNGSTDGTDEVARKMMGEFPEVALLQLSQRGRGRALRLAWSQSTADIVAYMDVDLSTELEALPKLITAIHTQGYEVATGSRLHRLSQTTRGFKREFISRCYNVFIKAVLWTSFTDAQCGFKAVSRRTVNEIVPQIEDQAWFFDTELLVLAEKQGYRIFDQPVRWVDDPDSRVRIMKTAWEDIKGVLRVRWNLWRNTITPATQASSAPSKL
jgi:glycosyltransferase involved in cell wall biosynthesis